MSEPHADHDTGHEHVHGPDLRAYLTIAIALSVFTAASFIVNSLVRGEVLSASMGFLLILGVAIVKATLVGMYFMHLKWDWGNLYFLIIPCFILATLLVVVLLPDILIAWL